MLWTRICEYWQQRYQAAYYKENTNKEYVLHRRGLLSNTLTRYINPKLRSLENSWYCARFHIMSI